MGNDNEQINQLLTRLEILSKQQEVFAAEISKIRAEVYQLKMGKATSEGMIPSPKTELTKPLATTQDPIQIQPPPFNPPKFEPATIEPAPIKIEEPPRWKTDVEKFIGENLINKIGIAILVIGVGIGAKYSIDNDLVSPLTRIILGYLAGASLLGVGMKLKANYENFSAVLVSGAMAIFYFITFFAYSFYGLIPQPLAFGLMVLFTIFTVLAAIQYDNQIIAQFGLVGAYGVPYLLGGDSGNVKILFVYMAIINIGILFTSFKKHWQSLYYAAFILTWLIFSSWIYSGYNQEEHFTLAFIFLTVFFAIFYVTFLAYKFIQKQQFSGKDVWLMLANSLVYYGFGMLLLSDYYNAGEQVLGLFTLGNALIHFVVSVLVYKQELGDRKLFYLISGLVLVFITIAIPVELDGKWITLFWAGEAALLFWIGRTKDVSFYEKLSYPLIFLAFASLVGLWGSVFEYGFYTSSNAIRTPILNIIFLTGILVASAFGFINYIHQKPAFHARFVQKQGIYNVLTLFLSGLFILVLFITFRLEIETYWRQLHTASTFRMPSEEGGYSTTYRNDDLLHFKNIWQINYLLFFLTTFSLFNIKKLKNRSLGLLNLGFNVIGLLLFLTGGIALLSTLRGSYLSQHLGEYYEIGKSNLYIRYISYAFVGLLLFTSYQYVRQAFMKKELRMPFDLLLHISILTILSSELIHWMELAHSTQSYKLGLSILWGIYALILIALGIWKNKKHLRLMAIVLFALTLMKLFFYDIATLNTLAKTVVFVSLGILLLLISFLYNKYKHLIIDEPITSTETIINAIKTDENDN